MQPAATGFTPGTSAHNGAPPSGQGVFYGYSDILIRNQLTETSGGESAAGANAADLELADAVRLRDRKAIAEFVRCYADSIYGYIAARLSPNRADADDLTQDVFLAAWRGIGGYNGGSPLRAWLLGIARHKVEDYYRARLRVADFEEAGEIASADIEIGAALDGERLRNRTIATLARLREEYRILLQWRYWEQKPTSDIARELGRTDKSVERMLARAREQFRKEWGQDRE